MVEVRIPARETRIVDCEYVFYVDTEEEAKELAEKVKNLSAEEVERLDWDECDDIDVIEAEAIEVFPDEIIIQKTK